MSTVRYFRFDDAGAPQLSGTVGSLVNILRACLVGTNGVAYGSKPSAGWTEEFVGAAANIAVFRNNQAEGFSGCWVRIHDNAPGTGGAREAYLNVYASMTDVNTGTQGTRTFYLRKSSALNTTARNWMIAADGGTCWLYIWLTGDPTSGSQDGKIALFGDYESDVATGAYRYCAAGGTFENYGQAGAPASLLLAGQGGTSVSSQSFQVAPPSGVGSVLNADMMFVTLGGATNNYIGSSTWPASPDPAGNRRFLESPLIRCSVGCIGRIRGLQLPFERLYTIAQGELVPGSSDLRVMRSNASGSSGDEANGAIAVNAVGPW